jgi:hypothetical protein
MTGIAFRSFLTTAQPTRPLTVFAIGQNQTTSPPLCQPANRMQLAPPVSAARRI